MKHHLFTLLIIITGSMARADYCSQDGKYHIAEHKNGSLTVTKNPFDGVHIPLHDEGGRFYVNTSSYYFYEFELNQDLKSGTLSIGEYIPRGGDFEIVTQENMIRCQIKQVPMESKLAVAWIQGNQKLSFSTFELHFTLTFWSYRPSRGDETIISFVYQSAKTRCLVSVDADRGVITEAYCR